MNKEDYKKIVANWIEDEKLQTSSASSRARYQQAHQKRFSYLFHFITQKFPAEDLEILDVGKSELTLKLAKYYRNIATLGFAPEKDEGGHTVQNGDQIPHFSFDLNQAKKIDSWLEAEFDIIIFSEVIEHLSQAPEFALLFFHYLLKKNGVLVCTTPNAAALFRRYKLLFGFQPFARIRLFSKNPGHYREYTKKELIEMGKKCGFATIDHRYLSFNQNLKSWKEKIVEKISAFYPAWNWSQLILWKKK